MNHNLYFLFFLGCVSCATLPEEKIDIVQPPKSGIYLDLPPQATGEYVELGDVKTKINFKMSQMYEDEFLCQNAYHRGLKDLLHRAEAKGGNAIMNIRSVVFYLDGKNESFKTPECSFETEEGQILMQAKVIRLSKL